MELTDWFDNGEKPVHIGVYERKGFGKPFDTWYNYWNGKYFGYLGSTPEEAVTAWVESGGKKSYHQDYPWRGVKSFERDTNG